MIIFSQVKVAIALIQLSHQYRPEHLIFIIIVVIVIIIIFTVVMVREGDHIKKSQSCVHFP